MVIKMVATDIDGTILPHQGQFHQTVIDCIQNLEKSGIKVILITGRMHRSAKNIANMLNLKNYIVSYQGALVCDNSQEENVIYERYIPNDVSKEILNWAKKNNIFTNLYMKDYLYIEKINDYSKKYTGEQQIPFEIVDFSNLKIDNVNKILLIDYNDADKVTEYRNYLQEKYPELYIVKSTDYFCEVCNKEATKGDGLRCLQNFYGISKEETLCIGDHNNDLELLLAGGIKVAMGNATEELKAVADYVTDTCENDGFVKAVEKFVKAGANV